jgi:hypothetical protein
VQPPEPPKLESLVKSVQPLDRGEGKKKGKKGQARRQASKRPRGQADGEAGRSGEQSDDKRDGFEAELGQAARREGDSTVAGPSEGLESKREPPETKAAKTVDEWLEWLEGTAPAPKPKKKNKKGKRNTVGKNRQASGAVADGAEGEAKGRADGEVVGEGGENNGDRLPADQGTMEIERLASQMGPPTSLPAIEEGPEGEPEPDPAGGEQVTSGVASGPTQQVAVEAEVVPDSNRSGLSTGLADEVSTLHQIVRVPSERLIVCWRSGRMTVRSTTLSAPSRSRSCKIQ